MKAIEIADYSKKSKESLAHTHNKNQKSQNFKSPTLFQTSNVISLTIAALCISLFWLPRLAYWFTTTEAPFSDMADYLSIGNGVLANMDFSHSNFWRAYKPPTLPLLIAFAFGVSGTSDILAWQIFQSIILFTGVSLVCYELYLRAGNFVYPILLFLVVSLSKSSIFWSLKIATEGTMEGLCYLFIGIWLRYLRTKRISLGFAAGSVATLGVLNRPQFLPIPFLCIAALALALNLRTTRLQLKVALQGSTALLLGLIITWSPWILRNYLIYDAFVPLSTQGPYSFLWELGQVKIPLENGTFEYKDVNELQAEAGKFTNDLEASRFAQRGVSLWITEHLLEYPEYIWNRMWRMLFGTEVELTKVSRDDLFHNPINSILLDKNHVLSVIGLAGLILLPLITWDLIVFPIIFYGNWLFGCLFLSCPRVLEPYLTILLFGALAGVWLMATETIRFLYRRLITPILEIVTIPQSD